MTTRDPISYFTFQDKTSFIPYRYIYPECFFHIEDKPDLFPGKCFITDSCPVGANCGDVLVRRVNYLFNEVMPTSEVLIAYFKYRDRPKSIRGLIFNRNLDPPHLSVLNPYAFKKFQRESTMYNWFPSDEYLFMGGSEGIISIESITKP